MEIDHEAEEWPYLQLYAQLRSRIIDGTYPPGRRIPSLVTIEQETGLSTDTIRKAIKLLAEEGLVRIVRSRGTFVTSRPPKSLPAEPYFGGAEHWYDR